MSSLLLGILMVLLLGRAMAQVATNYTFSQSAGTYTPITGGTLLWSGTFDDAVSGAQTIPAFTFDGVAYTQMYVSTNGFITFGNAPAGNNYTPLSSNAAYAGAISAFGADMNNTSSGGTATRNIRWQAVGDEIVVQWQNVRRYNLAGWFGSNPENFDLQVRLNTVSGVISVIYDGLTNHNNSTNYQPQVGLRGPNNTFATNVNNREVTNGANNWNSSLAGSGNANACRFTSGTSARAFSNGQTYTWTPSSCNALPAPGNTTGPATTCNGIPFDLSVANHAIGTTYQWEMSTTSASGPWTVFGSGSSVESTTQAMGTWYRAAVTCDGYGTVYSYVLYVGTAPVAECYCDAMASDPGFERITRVVLADVDHSSTANTGYEDHTSVTANLLAGLTYDLSVYYGFAGALNGYATDQVLVWIDLDQNGSFADVGELVFASANGLSPQNGNVTIPGSAITGTTRMRVRLHDTSTGQYANTPNTTPCGNSTYGQVEDYTVSIEPAVLYSTTSGLMTDDIWSLTPLGMPSGLAVSGAMKVVVQSGHNITVTGLQTVGDLDLQAGGSLVLDTEQRMVVEGNDVLLNGTIQGNGELSLESSDATNVVASGTKTIGDLIVNTPNGTNLTGNFDIVNSLRIEAGILNATSANVRLRSNATGTARLGTVASGADYLGELTMERHIPGGVTNWRLLGSPVEGRTVADWNNDFFTAGFPGSNYPNFYVGGVLWPSIRWYDETVNNADANAGLVGVTGTTQTLVPGRGYAVWSGDALGGTQAFKVDVKGEPVIAQDPLVLPMTWTNTGNSQADGLNLVSNPLPSPIAFNLISRGADVENAYWIYNPTNGNNASWNGIAGVNGANGTIQSSQGFWLKANGPAVTTSVHENAKVSGNGGGLFGGPVLQNGVLPLVRLKIHSGINAFSDEIVVVFQDGTPAYEAGDVLKMNFSHPSAPQIATRSSDGMDLSISMYGNFSTAITIPVLVDVPINGTYTITANQLDGINGYSCLVLEDLATGVLTPLAPDASYSFSILANADATIPRFMVHATAPVEQLILDVACNGGANGEAMVLVPGATSFDVIWMDASSNVLATSTGMQGSASMVALEPGNYMVSVSSGAGCGALTSSFTISEPSAMEYTTEVFDASCPGNADGIADVEVLGGTLPYSYTWSNGETSAAIMDDAGSYSVEVTDANGCMLVSETIWIGSSVGPVAAFVPANDIVMTGDPVMFLNSSTMAESQTWDFGDGYFSNEVAPEHSYTLPGTYMVTLTVHNGDCSDTHSLAVVVDMSTGITDGSAQEAQVWNDGDRFVIDHSFEGGMLQIAVLDAAGRTHLEHSITAAPGRVVLPSTELGSGIWLVRITSEGQQHTYRVPLLR